MVAQIVRSLSRRVLENCKTVEAFADTPWYILPLERQKDIAHIINRAQNGAILTIGLLAALNYETATNVRVHFSYNNLPFELGAVTTPVLNDL